MQTIREAFLSAYRHEVPDFIPNANQNNIMITAPTDRYYGSGTHGRDMFGVKWIISHPENPWTGMCPDPKDALLDDITEWERIQFPDLDAIDWQALAAERPAPEELDNFVVTSQIKSGLFERLNQIMGMENALCAFYEEPEALKDFFAALADFKLRYIDKVVEHLHPDIIQMHDDWGTAKSLFFSPDLWREFIKPHELRFAQYIHEKGCIYEHHSCGNITPLVGDLVEIGVDAINPLNTCNDLTYIKRTYGSRITLAGGFDNQFLEQPDITQEQFCTSFRQTMDNLAPGGSYIAYYLPASARTAQWAIDEINKYGASFYNR